MKVSILPHCCGFFFCLWIQSVFFSRFQSFLVKVCQAVSCDFGVFMRGGVLKFFSAISCPVHYLCNIQSHGCFLLKRSTVARRLYRKPSLQIVGCNAVMVMFLDVLSESNYSRQQLVKSGRLQHRWAKLSLPAEVYVLTRTSISFDLYAKWHLPPEFIFWSPNTQNDCT